MFYTYVLRSKKDGQWYTGATADLQKRFREHNEGKVPATKDRGPFKLIYYEACLNRDDAFTREKYLKTGEDNSFFGLTVNRYSCAAGTMHKIVL